MYHAGYTNGTIAICNVSGRPSICAESLDGGCQLMYIYVSPIILVFWPSIFCRFVIFLIVGIVMNIFILTLCALHTSLHRLCCTKLSSVCAKWTTVVGAAAVFSLFAPFLFSFFFPFDVNIRNVKARIFNLFWNGRRRWQRKWNAMHVELTFIKLFPTQFMAVLYHMPFKHTGLCVCVCVCVTHGRYH